jgi:oxalate decarboxylase
MSNVWPYLGAGALAGAAAVGALTKPQQQSPYPGTTKTTPFPHSFNIMQSPNTVSKPGGTIWHATADEAPILGVPANYILHNWAISMGLLFLNQGGVLEPHWHPNATELIYATQGAFAITIFLGGPSVIRESFVLYPGELAFVPKGFAHDIENVSSGESHAVLAWDNERFDTMGLSGMVGASDVRVMDATFGLRQGTFFTGLNGGSSTDIVIGLKQTGANPSLAVPSKEIQSNQATVVIGTPRGAAVSSRSTFHPTDPVALTSSYKFNLKAAKPAVATGGGTDTEGNARVFPALKGGGLACFSIVLKPNGIREPHWHPNAGEIHFVVSGKMQWAVTSPGGATEKGVIGPNVFFFAPPGFLHYFENPDPVNA